MSKLPEHEPIELNDVESSPTESQLPQSMLGESGAMRSKGQLQPTTRHQQDGEFPMSLKIMMPGISTVSTSITAGYLGLTGEARFSSAVLAGSYFIGCLYLLETANIARRRKEPK